MYIREFFTERLHIREYRKEDIDGYLRVIRQPEIYATTCGFPRNYSRLRAKWWFKMMKLNRNQHTAYEYAVILRENGMYLGNVGLININEEYRRADISYYIDRDYMNRGYATEAAREMLKYGFYALQYHKICGICMSVNPASRRVMEKLGMKYEGCLREHLFKDGVFYDLDHLSILKDEYSTFCKVEKTEFSTS